MMRRMLFGAGWLSTLVPFATAFGPMTESQKKESRFFDCIRAMEAADEDRDLKLTKDEYTPFVKKLSSLMFKDDSVLEPGDKLPQDFTELYKKLIVESGGTADKIDIYGASLTGEGSIEAVSGDRLEQLHNICQLVMEGEPSSTRWLVRSCVLASLSHPLFI
jgi:hypothetical protein